MREINSMREYSEERWKIERWLCKARGPVSNIIFNLVQFKENYNVSTGRFEVSLEKLRTGNLRTTFFDENENLKEGVIENTPIHWVVFNKKFMFWIKNE